MHAFNYTALDAKGQTKKGVVQASSEHEAQQSLQLQGLTPMSIALMQHKTVNYGIRLNNKNLVTFTRALATLLSAKIPLEQALSNMAKALNVPKIKALLLDLCRALREGEDFANALARHPRTFPAAYAASVAAGERSGALDKIMLELADYYERQHAFLQKMRQALIYPLVVTGVALVLVCFLLVFVVPKMINVFNSMHQHLPLITRVLLGISHIIFHYGWLIILAVVLVFLLARAALRRQSFKFKFHQLLLKLPFLRRVLLQRDVSLYSHTLGLLLSSGVAQLEAMQIASRVLGLLPIKTFFDAVQGHVREGGHLVDALARYPLYDPLDLQLIASGEQGGALSDMLLHVAKLQEQGLKNRLETALTLFEPMMILIMGAIVLFIVLAVLLPIFSMDQMIHLS